MHCKSCAYPLWNITARLCPECGVAFKPSEFEFTLNSVQFCCPSCRQPYYGVGEKGHLVPVEFDCVSCHTHIHMDDMVLLPTQGVTEQQTVADSMPWLNRRKVGRFKAWMGTIGRAMVSPGRLIQLTPEEASVGEALRYSVASNLIFMVCGLSFVGCMSFMGMGVVGAMGGGGGAGRVAAVLFSLVFSLLGLGVGFTVFIGLWALGAHGLLRITGPTAGPLGRTMHAICYSSGANVLTAIPCIGPYFSWALGVWWLVSAILMIKDGQKVSGGRATLAGLLPPLAMAGLAIGGFVLAMTVGTSRTFTTTMPVAPPGLVVPGIDPSLPSDAYPQAQEITSALIEYEYQHDGKYPPHALALVTGNPLTPADVILETLGDPGFTTPPILGVTPEQFTLLPEPTQRALIEQVEQDWGGLPEPVAHRVGDYVFTYHGVPADAGELWIVIQSPSPARKQYIITPFLVGLRDGTVNPIPVADFESSLALQNELRAERGLRPLRHPGDVVE